MSEYIEIETETTDYLDEIRFYTNLTLAQEGPETYDSVKAMEEGSPVAQALSYVEGIRQLRIEGSQMIVRRDPETPAHVIIADISSAIKDFFL